jgi:phosphonopyruvate decarboxylase
MPVVMCQNSGLGNTVNPLTSLNHAFKIPSLLIVTWRGQPGHHDEPQHAVMEQVMHELLNAIHNLHDTFPQSAELLAGNEGIPDHNPYTGAFLGEETW